MHKTGLIAIVSKPNTRCNINEQDRRTAMLKIL